jgi:hypothetical protein
VVAASVVAAAAGARGASAQEVHVGGVVYSQFEYLLSDSAGHGNAFDVKRAYLDVRGSFPNGVATRVTADIHRQPDGSLGYRLKYAYFTWRPENSPVTLKFGQIHTVWLDWEEGLWDYRMQGTMPIERYGYTSSSDLGAGVDGAWADQKLNVQLAAHNGESYHGAEGDKHKDVSARVSYRLLPSDDGGARGGLRLTGMTSFGAPVGGGTRNRYMGMVSWRSSRLTLAGEAARTVDGTDPEPNARGNFVSAYGVLRVPESPWALVARVDRSDPNVDVDDDALTRVIAGVSYRLGSNVLVLLDVDHVSYQGGPPSAAADARRSSLLFQTQFTF